MRSPVRPTVLTRAYVDPHGTRRTSTSVSLPRPPPMSLWPTDNSRRVAALSHVTSEVQILVSSNRSAEPPWHSDARAARDPAVAGRPARADPGGLAGGRRHPLGPVRGGDRQGPVPAGATHGHGVDAAGDLGADPARRGPTLVPRPQPPGLDGRAGVRDGADDHELGDLPVVRRDPARGRGDHRVPGAADRGGRRFPPPAGPDLGGPGRAGGGAARLQPGRPDAARVPCSPCSRPRRGRRTSCSASRPVRAGPV